MSKPFVSFSELGQRSPADALHDIFHQAGSRSAQWHAEGKEFISLAVGAPDNNLLPTALHDQLQKAAFARHGATLLNYRFTALERALQESLTARGATFDDDTDILVTSGGMEAINLAARSLLAAGDTVIVEAPAFTGTLGVFKEIGVRIVQVECGKDGVAPDDLEAAIIAHKPKLVSLMPDNQNPTGVTMPLQNRKAIADLLKKYGVYAIEDGAYSELGFDNPKIPPLQSFAPEWVLYATSFSKILWPAIRTGCLVAKKEIIAVDGRMKFNFNMVTSPVAQAMVEQFITANKGGLFAKRTATLREAYAKRYAAMDRALTVHLADQGITWRTPKGGMFVWLEAPAQVNFSELFVPALDNGVAFVPGGKCYANELDAPHNTARLNFASTPEDKMDEAVRRLAVTLRQAV